MALHRLLVEIGSCIKVQSPPKEGSVAAKSNFNDKHFPGLGGLDKYFKTLPDSVQRMLDDLVARAVWWLEESISNYSAVLKVTVIPMMANGAEGDIIAQEMSSGMSQVPWFVFSFGLEVVVPKFAHEVEFVLRQRTPRQTKPLVKDLA